MLAPSPARGDPLPLIMVGCAGSQVHYNAAPQEFRARRRASKGCLAEYRPAPARRGNGRDAQAQLLDRHVVAYGHTQITSRNALYLNWGFSFRTSGIMRANRFARGKMHLSWRWLAEAKWRRDVDDEAMVLLSE